MAEKDKRLTSTTLTTADLGQFAENQKAFQTDLTKSYVEPMVGLNLFSISYQSWRIIRDVYLEQDKDHAQRVKELDDWLAYLNSQCVTLGNSIARDGRYTGKWGEYKKYLEALLNVWGEIMSIKSELGLSIKLRGDEKY